MDALAIAWAVAGIAIGGFLTLLVLILSGQLVPASRAQKAEAAAEHYEDAYTTVKGLAERFGLMTDMTAAVLRATQTAAVTPPSTTQGVTP